MTDRETESQLGELPAIYWQAPSGDLVAPPIVTKPAVLPLADLPWLEVERLFLRLLERVESLTYGKAFGVAGQAQDGIDVYGRVRSPLATDTERSYVALQSRRVRDLSAASIASAVSDFLGGTWANRTSRFYYATTASLTRTELDEAVRVQVERLALEGIELVPWDVNSVSEALRRHPDIVDDFFSREWVRVFCGEAAASSLGTRLSRTSFGDLRASLTSFYSALFRVNDTGVSGFGFDALGAAKGDFVLLDVATVDSEGSLGEEIDRSVPVVQPRSASSAGQDGDEFRFRSRQRIRRKRRSAQQDGDLPRQRTDDWLSVSKRCLLIGAPGAGKSSILRFFVSDVLSQSPQSSALNREFGRSVPIWLPFAFLAAHLAESSEHSILSAAHAWLTSQDQEMLWDLVRAALEDDRLVLIVDGLDEWVNRAAAEQAIARLEEFLASRPSVRALAATRPYALRVLPLAADWHRAQVAPLTDEQQRQIAERLFDAPDESVGEAHFRGHVGRFLAELSRLTQLDELTRLPLFLVLLGALWGGEPLPPRRHDIYRRLIDLLVIRHPQMRRRASRVSLDGISAEDAQLVFAAVAYRLRQSDATGAIPRAAFRRLVVDALQDENVLFLPEEEARSIADAVLAVAEQQFGLIVSHGSGTVGFLHRVLFEHLAGDHLASLPLREQTDFLIKSVDDPSRRDVVLALLCSLKRPSDVQTLLAATLAAAEGNAVSSAYAEQLVADAVAANVALTPTALDGHLDLLVARVETHPSGRHRRHLLNALAVSLRQPHAKRRLMPVFQRWMNAATDDPHTALWYLRFLELPDEVVWPILLWGLRHPEGIVRINAAGALAERFGGRSDHARDLADVVEQGRSVHAQAAALHALVRGWPGEAAVEGLVAWARTQSSFPLRVVALDALVHQSRDNPDVGVLTEAESAWLTSLIEVERLSSEWRWISDPLVAAVVKTDQRLADVCLATLKNNDGSKDRDLAWYLGCTAYATDGRFRDLVAQELREQEHPLILHSLAIMPAIWAEDTSFRQAVVEYLQREGTKTIRTGEIYYLTQHVRGADIRDLLIGLLDVWRPSDIVRALLLNYSEDQIALDAIRSQFQRPLVDSVKYSFVAVEALGSHDGVDFLVRVLKDAPADCDISYAGAALAAARNAGEDSSENQHQDVSESAEGALAKHRDLAGICLSATATASWYGHSDEILRAWPEDPAVQERAWSLLRSREPRPQAVLRAYSGRTDQPSQKLVAAALNMLGYLDAPDRMLAAHFIDDASLELLEAAEVLQHWALDADSDAQRASAITLAKSLRVLSTLDIPAVDHAAVQSFREKFREEVRAQLRAYGSDLELRRQIGWIATLITGDLGLLDDLFEHYDEHQAVGVHLRNLWGDPDPLLAQLVAEGWDELLGKLGVDGLFDRLSRGPASDMQPMDARRREVWSVLATVAGSHPAIAALLAAEVEQDSALAEAPAVIRWFAAQRPDVDALRAALESVSHHTTNDAPALLDLVLTTPWEPIDQIRTEVLRAAQSTWQGGDGARVDGDIESTRWMTGWDRVVFSQLFPDDPLTAELLVEMKSALDNQSGDRWHWPDAIAVAVAATAPEDLPQLLMSLYTSLVIRGGEAFLSDLVDASSRRLRRDQRAVEHVTAVAKGGALLVDRKRQLFRDREYPPGLNQAAGSACRTFVLAQLLAAAGNLAESDRIEIAESLAAADNSQVLVDPLTGEEAPLRIALLDFVIVS